MKGVEGFNGIGGKHTDEHPFRGTFDGHNYTVKNFSVINRCPDLDEDSKYINGCHTGCNLDDDNNWDACAGFFTSAQNATIKNLTVENATIKSTHFAGGIVGWASATDKKSVVIENCHVIGSTVTSNPITINEKTECGDKVGGIVGLIEHGCVKNCSVATTTITAYRDLGAIVGCANTNSAVNDCEIGENVVVSVDNTNNYKKYNSSESYNAGNHVGRIEDDAGDVKTGNTGTATVNLPTFEASADTDTDETPSTEGTTGEATTETPSEGGSATTETPAEGNENTEAGETPSTEGAAE